jgi:hypothetical protein
MNLRSQNIRTSTLRTKIVRPFARLPDPSRVIGQLSLLHIVRVTEGVCLFRVDRGQLGNDVVSDEPLSPEES